MKCLFGEIIINQLRMKWWKCMKLMVDEKEYRMLNLPSGDLRISITNGCNMRCVYCHNEGQQENAISFLAIEDIKYIVSETMKYGLKKIRITGGEPLIHPEVISILRMLKDEMGMKNVGINTNGMMAEKLLLISREQLVNRVVIGMDYFDGLISKQSLIGVSSSRIKETAVNISNLGITVEIATVYDDNETDVISLVEWGLRNHITVKVIEKTISIERNNSPIEFDKLIVRVKNKFGLRVGITADLQEYYLTNGQTRIKFFQSHCNRKECDICKGLHMRISCDGKAKPCIQREDTAFDLLSNQFDINMKMAIANLGNGPGNAII